MNKPQINKNKIRQEDLKNDNNALNPHLLAKQVLIRGENRREFIDFVAKIRSETLIKTKIEEELLKKYIFSAWKLARLRKIEKHLLNKQQSFTEEEELFSNTKKRIRNLKRIEITNELLLLNNQQEKLEKVMDKSLRQLREEQKINSQN